MKTEQNSVVDGKIDLTDEQIGKLQRKLNEAIRRIKQGAIDYDETVDVLQNIIIEGRASLHMSVVKGINEIKLIEYLVDCDAQPFIPPGWSIEEHKKRGILRLNVDRTILHLSRKQKKGLISGHELRREFEKLPTMNANVLDYFLAHPEYIPNKWKSKGIIFWGTIYRQSDGDLYVRYLYWDVSSRLWSWQPRWLNVALGSSDPAALASDLKI